MGELYEYVPTRLASAASSEDWTVGGYGACVNVDGTLTLNGIVLDARRPQKVPGFANWLQWCPAASIQDAGPTSQTITKDLHVREHFERELVVLCGSSGLFEAHSAPQTYNLRQNTWRGYTPLTMDRDDAAVLCTGPQIYVIGGLSGLHNRCVITASVETCENGCWAELAPMQTPRTSCAAAFANGPNGDLFVFGGDSGRCTLDSVEVFRDKKWTKRKAMPTARRGLHAAALGRKVYLCGGCRAGEESGCASVDIYDMDQDTWTRGPPMQRVRTHFGLAVLGGRIFVAGGKNGLQRYASVECYDERQGTWSFCSPMPTARSHLSLTVVGAHIYAIGGFDGSNVTATIEKYDPETDLWSAAGELPSPRWGHGSVVISRAWATNSVQTQSDKAFAGRSDKSE